MSGRGLVAIYRWQVAPEHEADFRSAWEAATRALRAAGGLGSLLGQAQNGEMVAIALWPDAAARKTAFATMDDSIAWPPCTRLEPILVDPLSDQWALDSWRMISNGE